MIYVCDTGKNTECTKSWCCSGKCFCTTNSEYASEVIHPLDPLGCHSCQYGAYFNSTQGWQCGKFSKEMCAERNGYEPIHSKEVKDGT